MDPIDRLLQEITGYPGNGGRPLVTLAYAQSLDGSIALHQDQQLHLSGPESKRFTHRLRAAHDAILVGIGTILADDPRLTARLVGGPHPQPVILDSRLRIPVEARILHGPRPAWIAAARPVDPERACLLQKEGARILEASASSQGMVDLEDLLHQLFASGIHSLMVEGGGKVITSFLQQRWVDRVALTIAPVFVGGYPGYHPAISPENPAISRLQNVEYIPLGEDLIVLGKLN